MLKLNKFFAFLALFLGLYVSGIAINLNQALTERVNIKFVELVKEKKSSETQIPSQFIDIVDEREIDEDDQIKLYSTLLVKNCCLLYTQLTPNKVKDEYLPQQLTHNFSIKEPRVLLFHSWKLYHS